jgi:hypothetical protein
MTIDDVIGAMYESMCFERGQRPDWKRQAELFAPHARLVRVNDEGVFEFDPGSFRHDLEGKISSGAIASFWEGELRRETKEFGDIAHVLSLYETRPSRGAEPASRALKSIQMFKRSGRWWISAMIWRREGGDFRIDPGDVLRSLTEG